MTPGLCNVSCLAEDVHVQKHSIFSVLLYVVFFSLAFLLANGAHAYSVVH